VGGAAVGTVGGLGAAHVCVAEGGPDPTTTLTAVSGAVVGSLLGYAAGFRRGSFNPHEGHSLSRELQSRGRATAVAPGAAGVFTVVLTGGPCAGKTSSQENLGSTLTQAGYDVYFAPEVPTILMNGGCQYPGLDPEKADELAAFEDSIIKLQMQLEDSFVSVARSTGRPSVVVFDRGLLDIPAYLPPATWQAMLSQLGYTEAQFAERYNMVIHLVTTAHGVEDVYLQQKSNNPARSESPQQARDLDDKVFGCWWGRIHSLPPRRPG